MKNGIGKKKVIIIKAMGGLGNQMYQYAMYEKLLGMHKNVKFDLISFDKNNTHADKRNFMLDSFPNVKYEVCTKRERARYVDDSKMLLDRIRRKVFGSKTDIYREHMLYDENIFQMEDAYLLGYWNCQKYYDEMMPYLREKFKFPESSDERNIELFEKIKDVNSVSIHIRRGDYLESRYATRFGHICTDEYYDRAIEYVRERVENPVFIVFSDDKEYVKSQYQGKDYIVVDWNESEEMSLFDLQLMSACKHNICANSTFSKWAALLNDNADRIRICPLKHTADDKIPILQLYELYPDWVWIDSDGIVYEEKELA